MNASANQRWRARRESYRPAGEPINTARHEVAPIRDDVTAKRFVLEHHYSATYPAARFRFGLYEGPHLVGVAVFSHPCNDKVLTGVFPGPARDSVELGRFVLLDRVAGNGETWFLARCFELLRAEVAGVVSYSVTPFLAAHYGRGGTVGRDAREPVRTITPKDHNALVSPFLTKYSGTSADGHVAEVRAFLLKYYGGNGEPDQQQSLFAPLHTVPSRDRFGLVTVAGVDYQIVDIGMRMLQPHELFAAQGFPSDYEIAPEFNGRPLSKAAQTSCAGNSVCPPMAQAIVAANARAA